MRKHAAENNIGLVLLAAGFGTRFGGDKQLSIVGPAETIIMDYSIYDAWRSGYNWVTVILREEIADRFEREVGRRWRSRLELRYSIQKMDSCIPERYRGKPWVAQRHKAWGTAHALLCAREQVDGPFAVANADDFYGYHALREIFLYLNGQELSQAMVGFRLGQTLSENGAVSRGICHTYRDAQGREWLDNIREHTELLRGADGRIRQHDLALGKILDENILVSMNLFGLQPEIFSWFQQQFEEFLAELNDLQNPDQALSREFYLPTAVEIMLEKRQSKVAILHSPDSWFGLTYLQDLPLARRSIAALIHQDKYPANLFAKATISD